jgi:histidine kinase-like protein
MPSHQYAAGTKPFRARRHLTPVHSGGALTQAYGDNGPGHPWLTAAAEMAGLTCCPVPLGEECPPLVCTRIQEMDARQIRGGREFSLAALQQWGLTDRREDIATVVSELLTNAFRHAVPGLGHSRPGWPVRLGLLHSGPRVLCAVADPSSSVPVLRKPHRLAESGRGLQVVCALSEAWGYTAYATPTETGKVVWATFPAVPG